MSATLLLERLKTAGVRISRRGESLWLEPRAAVPLGLTSELRRHKPELLAIVDDVTAAFHRYADRNGFTDDDRERDIGPVLADPAGWLEYLRDADDV